jgi:hypothetical protein
MLRSHFYPFQPYPNPDSLVPLAGKDYNTSMARTAISSLRLAVAGFLLISMGVFAVSSASAQDSDTAKRGRKYKAPPPTAHFEITVIRATNGKPVENAAVIFHPLAGGRDNGNMELKTNDEGKAVIDLLELGSNVRVQIIAPGFQTYGEDYKIDKDAIAVEVRLNRPGAQYSIYKKSEGAKGSDKPAEAPQATAPDAKPDAKADSKADAKPDAPKDATDTKPEPKPQDSTPQ